MRAALLVLLLTACAKHAVKDATPEQVATCLEAKTCSVFDANALSFRQQYGVVPGATLLDSSSRYDLALLGTDRSRPLIFYCSNRL